ncbi:MAG: glycosyltransferase family 2 protein [Eubacterium sp.]
MKTISIIVPVYKVEQYLDRCIESIVNQTYKNLEIILVDDGSPDKCPEICDKWAQKDCRIIVIHQENSGVADARNKALDICTGDFVGFVDSDDFVDSDMFEILVKQLEENDADISRCTYKRIHDNSDSIEYIKNNKTISVKSGTEYLVDMFNDNTLNSPCWNKLYSKKIIGNNRFLDGYKIGEDNYFNYQVIKNAQKIVLINQSLYNYTYRTASITSVNDVSAWIQNVELHIQIFKRESGNARISAHIANVSAAWILDGYAQIVKVNAQKKHRNQLDSIVSENYSAIMNCITNKTYKKRLFVLKHFKYLYLFVLKLRLRR